MASAMKESDSSLRKASAYVNVETEDEVLLPSSLQPRNLRLDFVYGVRLFGILLCSRMISSGCLPPVMRQILRLLCRVRWLFNSIVRIA